MPRPAGDEIVVLPSAPEAPSPSAAQPEPVRDHWRTRWFVAALLGFTMVTIPVMAAIGVALFAALLVPPPPGASVLVWWAVVFMLSAAAACGTQHLVRRTMPLVGLLRLALLFPADVPSRLGLAMRAGSVRDLQRASIDLRDDAGHEPVDAAARVVAYAAALHDHDRFTRGHCERVRAYTDLLAAELGIPKHEREKLRWAALLHDIGKLEVSKQLLNKPGALDQDEWLEMRKHPAVGGRLVEPLRPWLGDWVDAVGQHHERFDGNGYPLGLVGTDIALGARIVAVADAYETITAARPYKKPIPHAVARKELVAQAGKDFDPVVVHAMLRLSVRQLRWAAGPLAAFGDLFAARLIASVGPRAAGTREDLRLVRIAAVSSVIAATFLAPAGTATSTELPQARAQESALSAGFLPVSTSVTVRGALAGRPVAPPPPAPPPAPAVHEPAAPAPTAAPPAAAAPPATPAAAAPAAEPTQTNTRAVPATPATPAQPGHHGQRATPATPATPAIPASGRGPHR